MTPGSLKLDGERQQGETVRVQNVRAATAVASVVRSSLGPIGLDKMLVDDIGEVTITNDGATILSKLDVQHPAGKVLIELSQLQDKEVGDGTTTVVLLAAELLRVGQELINKKVHPNTVITGFRKAGKAAIAFLKQHCALPTKGIDRDILTRVAQTSMNSKILAPFSDIFAPMVVDACLSVTSGNKCPTSRISIVKSLGKSFPESTLIPEGLAVNNTRISDTMPRRVEGAKVAVITFALKRTQLPLGVQFRLKNAENLQKIQDEEIEQALRMVDKIIKAGANVIFTSNTIDELCTKPIIKAGAIGVRHVSDAEINMIARATGATIMTQIFDEDGNDTFKPEWLGECDVCEQVVVGYNEMLVLRGGKKETTASIVLRGPNTFALEEANRTLRDALSAVKRVIESHHIVSGGGAIEAALSVYLTRTATQQSGKEQVAMLKFAEALLVIPKILANNAALDSIDVVARLRAAHNAAQEANELPCFASLNLETGEVRNGIEAGVIEPGMSKVKSIQFATEAAITILRIDDLIKVKPPEKKKGEED